MYCLGELRAVPDIAIEIAITSGGIDKLSVYQGLGVTEVWFLRMETLPFRELVPHSRWQNDQFILYRLQEEAYMQIARSEFLPDLDLVLLSQFVNSDNQTEAVIAYRDIL